MNDTKRTLIKLFFSTLYLSAFTFGGGYVIIMLMKKNFVDKFHWIKEEEMLDLVAIAQSSPGAIAINGSVVIGYKMCGIAGVITALIATILPPFIIISIISIFYNALGGNFIIGEILKGMQIGVSALIASIVYELASNLIHEKNLSLISIMILSFIAISFLKLNVIYVIIICISLGLTRAIIPKWRKQNDLS